MARKTLRPAASLSPAPGALLCRGSRAQLRGWLFLVVGQWLLSRPSRRSVFPTLHGTRVRPGCTIAAIEHFLGDGVVVTEKHQRALVAAAEECSRVAPDSWPDGVTADDHFIGYTFGPTTSYLQFRDGVLVNFNPRDYDKPFQFTGLCP